MPLRNPLINELWRKILGLIVNPNVFFEKSLVTPFGAVGNIVSGVPSSVGLLSRPSVVSEPSPNDTPVVSTSYLNSNMPAHLDVQSGGMMGSMPNENLLSPIDTNLLPSLPPSIGDDSLFHGHDSSNEQLFDLVSDPGSSFVRDTFLPLSIYSKNLSTNPLVKTATPDKFMNVTIRKIVRRIWGLVIKAHLRLLLLSLHDWLFLEILLVDLTLLLILRLLEMICLHQRFLNVISHLKHSGFGKSFSD